jgi:hypothetical protein
VGNPLGFKHVTRITEIEAVHHLRDRYAGKGRSGEDGAFFGYRDEL